MNGASAVRRTGRRPESEHSKDGCRRIPLASAWAAATAAVVLAACGTGRGTSTPAGAVVASLQAPLATTLPTPSGDWAVIAMGNLSDPLNTFWQLLFRPAGGALWSLVTPRGVASNGGLVVAGGNPAPLTVGIEPSNNLRFSPLAQSPDGGHTWSPGLVPGALAPVPDALAAAPTGALMALVARGGGVLRSDGDPSTWTKVTDRGALATSKAGRSCGVGALSAVGFQPAGGVLVGTTCTKPGRVGVFVRQGGVWRLLGRDLPGRTPTRQTSVVRL